MMSILGVNMCLHEHAETGLSKLHLEMGQILELHEKEYLEYQIKNFVVILNKNQSSLRLSEVLHTVFFLHFK